eukprot:6470260-Amphidinium_carterae.4
MQLCNVCMSHKCGPSLCMVMPNSELATFSVYWTIEHRKAYHLRNLSGKQGKQVGCFVCTLMEFLGGVGDAVGMCQ